jgi:hypothetical protein
MRGRCLCRKESAPGPFCLSIAMAHLFGGFLRDPALSLDQVQVMGGWILSIWSPPSIFLPAGRFVRALAGSPRRIARIAARSWELGGAGNRAFAGEVSEIVPRNAKESGTSEIVRRTGKSKTRGRRCHA